MRIRTIAPIALALFLALPAAADHRRNDSRDDAGAKLADQLQKATAELYDEAAEHGRVHGIRAWRALHALRSLQARADRFEDHVARFGLGHPGTEYQLRLVADAYQTAESRRSGLHHGRRLDDEFARVDRLIHRLDHRLARRDEGRHDERRYARRDDDRNVEGRVRLRDGDGRVALRISF